MRVLVTGSSGQIGSFVVDEARRRGGEAHGLDLRASGWTDHVGDVRDADACRRALAGCDAVVHCAAQVSVQSSIADPLADASHNVLGTLTLLEAARASGSVARFVMVSSAAVYGRPERVPVDEQHPLAPLSPYGASKLAAESYARTYQRLHGLGVVVVRPFNVYSERQAPDNPYSGVISRFAARVNDKRAPTIYGSGEQTRDFVHARDVASWLVDLAQAGSRVPPGTVLNLGTGVETSVASLARAMMDLAGLRGVEAERAPPAPGEIARSVADVSRMRSFGMRPTVTLEEGLRALVPH